MTGNDVVAPKSMIPSPSSATPIAIESRRETESAKTPVGTPSKK